MYGDYYQAFLVFRIYFEAEHFGGSSERCLQNVALPRFYNPNIQMRIRQCVLNIISTILIGCVYEH